MNASKQHFLGSCKIHTCLSYICTAVLGCTTHDCPDKSKAVNWQSRGRYFKNVTFYILLVTSIQWNVLQ